MTTEPTGQDHFQPQPGHYSALVGQAVARRHASDRRRVLGTAAALVVAGVLVVVAVPRTSTGAVQRLTVSDPSGSASTSPVVAPPPSSSALSSAPDLVHASSVRTSATTGAPASDPLAGECVGPLPPGHVAVPECDDRRPHAGPPPSQYCISDFNACAWPDAWGAVSGGIRQAHATVSGRSVATTWVESDGGSSQPDAVHTFVVRLFSAPTDPDDVRTFTTAREQSVPASTTSFTFDDVPPGRYVVGVAEINNSGTSGYSIGDRIRVEGSSPSSASPWPSASSPSSSVTPSSSAAPSSVS